MVSGGGGGGAIPPPGSPVGSLPPALTSQPAAEPSPWSWVVLGVTLYPPAPSSLPPVPPPPLVGAPSLSSGVCAQTSLPVLQPAQMEEVTDRGGLAGECLPLAPPNLPTEPHSGLSLGLTSSPGPFSLLYLAAFILPFQLKGHLLQEALPCSRVLWEDLCFLPRPD